jgi:hypothetical protein
VQWLFNLPTAIWRRLLLILQGLWALLWLIGAGIGALLRKGGTVGSRLGAAIGGPAAAAPAQSGDQAAHDRLLPQ